MSEGTRDDAPAPTTPATVAASPEPDGRMAVVRRSLERGVKWPSTGDRRAEEEWARMETAARHVMDAREGTSDKAQREELFQLYLRLGSEIQASIAKSAEKRRQSRIWGRGLVAVTSLAAALAGLAMALNYHGFGSRAFGIAVAVVGVWSTISTALRLDDEYERNSKRNRIYKRLLREIQLYLVSTFPTATPEQAASRLVKFSREFDRAHPAEYDSADGHQPT